MKILYEDAHLIVVDKPPGLPTQGAGVSLESRVRAYLRSRADEEVYLGTVQRLDRPVSGVLLWAKTSKSARRIAHQFAARDVRKEYWALVTFAPIAPEGLWVDWLRDDEPGTGRTRICEETDSYAKQAITRYACDCADSSGRDDPLRLILHPQTGRTHQLRVQSSSRGMPIVGDARYGSTRPFAEGIALHARRLGVRHPMNDRRMEFVADLPASWDDWDDGHR